MEKKTVAKIWLALVVLLLGGATINGMIGDPIFRKAVIFIVGFFITLWTTLWALLTIRER